MDPFLDEQDVLHIGGRLENAKLTPSEKRPPILPKYNEVIFLLIMLMFQSSTLD